MIRFFFWILTAAAWVLQARLVLAAQEILAPETIPVLQYVFALSLALLGGVASTLQRYAQGAPLDRWKLEVTRDIVCSILAGLVAFYGCKHWGVPSMLAAIFVMAAGWGGARFIEKAYRRAEKRVESL